MTGVQELAIAQLKEVLRLIETEERTVRRIDTGYFQNEITDIKIDLQLGEQDDKS